MTNTSSDNLPTERRKRKLSERLKALAPLTFRGQAVLFLFPLIVIISLVYTLESISTERKILRNEIIKKGETIAAIAARNAELSLLSENLEQLKNSAQPLMGIKDVAFVSFLNRRSEMLLHEGKRYPLAAALTATPDQAITFSEHDDVFEFIVPVVTVKAREGLFLFEGTDSAPPLREQIGWVRIGLSKQVMTKSEHHIIVRGGILAVVFSIAGVLLLYLFITLATRPLYALINAVQEVREGEHPEVAVVSPSSEIGRLSAEFNRMSRAIKEREDELQENVLELEMTQEELQGNLQELEMQIEAREEAEADLRRHRAELAHTIDVLHDEIMERQRAEEERVRLAQAIEQAAEAIFMADNQWSFTYVNPAFERISGYIRDEVLGRDTAILRSSALESGYYDQIREIIGRDHVWSGRITTRKKDGSFFEAETTVSSVRDSIGTIINYVFILRDITNELRLERELRQSQKMEAIGTLAGGIAHDFNNILTAIIGYTDMAQRKTSKNQAVVHDLERVQQASSRAKELVSRILAFSRQGEQERKPVQVASIVEEVLKLLRSALPTTIEIHRHITTSSNGDTVLADPTQLHQVLMNLGTNAAHAMRDQGGVLGVSLSDVDADASLIAHNPDLRPGPCVRLTVSDTGHGMEDNVKERIFDPYFTTKKVGEGTGMGLAVVQGIIKNHGGAISVYSEPGRGTTFHIFLPKFAGELVNQATADELPSGGTERILFVDDELMLAELGQELLESLGYTVTVTLNGLEALKLFRSAPQEFDLVITDMTMPGLTGKELARELMAVRPDIPIILCTGFSEQINEKQAKETGIRGYVMKPYATNSLNKTIRKLLAEG
jgi:PAS domain S-box-containing protein